MSELSNETPLPQEVSYSNKITFRDKVIELMRNPQRLEGTPLIVTNYEKDTHKIKVSMYPEGKEFMVGSYSVRITELVHQTDGQDVMRERSISFIPQKEEDDFTYHEVINHYKDGELVTPLLDESESPEFDAIVGRYTVTPERYDDIMKLLDSLSFHDEI